MKGFNHMDFMADLERELIAEEEMLQKGVYRYRRNFSKAVDRDTLIETAPASRILDKNLNKVIDRIDQFKKECKNGGAGFGHKAFVIIQDVPSKVLALIVSQVVINLILKPIKFSSLACRVGNAVEDNLKFSKFRKEHPKYVEYCLDDYRKKQTKNKHIKGAFNHLMEKKDVRWDRWSDEGKAHVGFALIHCFMEATELIEVETSIAKGKTTNMIQPKREVIEWIKDFNNSVEMLRPKFLPMVCEPKAWSSAFEGGYWHDMLQVPLIKKGNKQYLNNLPEMPQVYDALNAIQATAWKINGGVLGIITQLWEAGSTIALPSRYDDDLPPTPVAYDKNQTLTPKQKKRLETWKKETRDIRNKNAKSRGHRIQIELTLNIAEQFSREERIYFPYNLDYRGRVYAVPSLLNPQGADWAKAMLHFAEGDSIDNQTESNWLAIHGANLYGVDKVSFEERIAWVQSNEGAILAIAEDPYSNTMWSEADSPFQFLAFCLEWSGFKQQGYGFVSHLPIALDGTCNGLQHFSAMMLDEVGGAEVNLVPSDKPKDIYQAVCDAMKENVKLDVDKAKQERNLKSDKGAGRPSKGEAMLRTWLEWEHTNRKLTKRPVMILPYGGTEWSCLEYVQLYLKELQDEGVKIPFADHFIASQAITPYVWNAIKQVVSSAPLVMDWIQAITLRESKAGNRIEWTTPIGFPVLMENFKLATSRLNIKLYDKRYQPRLTKATSKIDVEAQVLGVSPNFVHSMDATALMMYVNKAKRQGLDKFALVHDSYGTTPKHTELASQLLREAFVELYRDHYPLEDLARSLGGEVYALPPKGKLNLDQILQSKFFFA
jgi:DNA-directed RNA polymerase